MFFQVLGQLRYSVQEHSGQILSVFNLNKNLSYNLTDERFEDGDSFIFELLKHDD